MVSLGGSLRGTFEQLYASGDPGFSELLARADDAADDEALAELIELDGRMRIDRGLPVSLQRYLDCLPDLDRRPVALDTAIDVTLRSISGTSRLEPDAVETLAVQYPSLAGPIREAAVLSEALWSTTGLRARFMPRSRRQTPCEFGPRIASGRARYELRRLLGAGAGGEVYLAVDRQLSEDGHPAYVAIKLLNASNSDPWARRRLVDEATKARRVTHANVARVLDLGISEHDEDFVVYEFVSGGDLAAWHTMHPMGQSLRARIALAARIARGVQAAHSAGLVHCDLKPGNILVSAADEPKVTDFGIAVRAGQPRMDTPDYDGDHPIGNMAFISPEQFRAEDGCLSLPSDIYALGGILYYLITGELPNGRTVEEVRRNHDRQRGRRDAASPRAVAPRLDRRIDAICRRAMALNPEARYSSAGALADDLDAWLRLEPIAWMKTSAASRARLWARRRPGLAAMLALLLITAVAGGLVAVRGWAVAAQRLDLALAEKARVDGAKATLQQALNGAMIAKFNKLDHNLLPLVMAMEWVGGDVVLDNPFAKPQEWIDRFKIVEALLAEEAAAGRGEEFESLFWKTVLAYWYTNDGKPERAEPLMDEAIPGWRARLRPGDHWLAQLETFREAAAVKRLVKQAASPAGLSPEARAEAEQRAAQLAAGLDLFQARHFSSPAHRTAVVALTEVNGPKLLDRADDRKRFEDILKKIDE
ncbi:MAG: serine/threonine protein kinase [Phycisphaerales bacterium]|nr:serine/threonine protein kinase [Phycisphaerales bacterium]